MKILRNTYVVHSISRNRNHARTEDRAVFRGDFLSAFKHWKQANEKYRAGLFYWDRDGQCTRLYASDDYRLEVDYHG